VLVTVVDSVTIGVGKKRIGAQIVFLLVRQAVTIGIGESGVSVISNFLSILHPIVIAIRVQWIRETDHNFSGVTGTILIRVTQHRVQAQSDLLAVEQNAAIGGRQQGIAPPTKEFRAIRQSVAIGVVVIGVRA